MNPQIAKFTLGADPELFLVTQEGKFISSVGKIGGTKDMPQAIGEGCAVQEDNVAVEFNIPPAYSIEEFQTSLAYSLTLLEAKAKDIMLNLSVTASAEFDPDQLNTPQARLFGCEPDFNAWTERQNPRPRAENKQLRSCGGHIHVGTELNGLDVIRAMDLFLGCPSTILDKDVRRRQLYGKAGAFRYKPYGVEYRTLSNFWLQSKDLIKWVYDQTQIALNWVETNTTNKSVSWDADTAGAIQACINYGNKDAYMMLDQRYGFGL